VPRVRFCVRFFLFFERPSGLPSPRPDSSSEWDDTVAAYATSLLNLTDLLLLVELTAVRRLADRGLSDQELAAITGQADATVRSVRTADFPGYLRADTTFHIHLAELTNDPALAGVARILLVPNPDRSARVERHRHHMAVAAREHRELVGMLADVRVSAVSDLLRRHIVRSWPPAC